MLPRLAFLLPLLCPVSRANSLQFYIEPTQKTIPTYVQQLVEGNIQRIQQGSRMRASVSLIYDGGYYILVDTPSATDLRGKEAMLKGIASRNIVPGEVQLVVTTHGHPDHFGQDNFFPNARHFFGSYEYSDDTFLSTELKTSPKMQLSRNVQLWNTPGHTSQDVSVMVSNVPCCGTVAVVGDLFYDEEDALNGTDWYAEAWNPLIGKLNRDKVICAADYIIPGHGKLFKISDEMKTNAACGAITSEDLEELTEEYGRKHDPSTVSFFYSYPTTARQSTTQSSPPTTTSTSTSTSTTTTPAPTTTTTSFPTTTTPFFVTVDQLPEDVSFRDAPQIRNLMSSVHEAIPYVVNNVLPNAANQLEARVKKAQDKNENILAPVVETAAMQLSRLLKMDTSEAVNATYPYTNYWQKTFNRLADDIPNLPKALNPENIESFKEKVRTYRHPAVDAVFKLLNFPSNQRV